MLILGVKISGNYRSSRSNCYRCPLDGGTTITCGSRAENPFWPIMRNCAGMLTVTWNSTHKGSFNERLSSVPRSRTQPATVGLGTR